MEDTEMLKKEFFIILNHDEINSPKKIFWANYGKSLICVFEKLPWNNPTKGSFGTHQFNETPEGATKCHKAFSKRQPR